VTDVLEIAPIVGRTRSERARSGVPEPVQVNRAPLTGGRGLLDYDDDLALGVPFAEIPQRLRHLTEPVSAVDDSGDLSGGAELNEWRQVLHAQSDGQETYLLVPGPSGHGSDQQDLQERGQRTAGAEGVSAPASRP